MWRLVTCSNFSDFGTPRFKFSAFGTPQPGWDPSLLPPDVAFLARRGLLDRVDAPSSALAFKHRVRPFHIEGFRIDVGGIRSPFRIRGGTVRDTVCTLPSGMRASSFDWKRGQRIGEAGNPGPARDTHEAGGIYYGQFDGEFKLGIYIKRLGATSADFEYVFAVPTRPAQPGACEARAREGPFICDVQFVKLRGTQGLRRRPQWNWTCFAWAPLGEPRDASRYLPRLDDLDQGFIAKTAGAAPVRYRTDPPPDPAEAAQHGADVGMPPARMAAEVARALWLAQEHGLDWSEQQCSLLLEAVVEYRGGGFRYSAKRGLGGGD